MRAHPLDGGSTHGRIGIGKGQPLLSPRLPGSDGGHAQAKPIDDAQQLIGVDEGRITDGQFDSVIAQFGDLFDIGLEITLERHCVELGLVGG